MRSLAARLKEGSWGLKRACAEARKIEGSPGTIRHLMGTLFSDAPELRKRAADVARRITECSNAPLALHAEELTGLLGEIDPAESRTRWHLGLVAVRVANTQKQRLRAARLMELMAGDGSNLVRCSAIEGLGVLAVAESSLRELAAETIERALRSGSKAEQCRAREARARLIRAAAWTGEGDT